MFYYEFIFHICVKISIKGEDEKGMFLLCIKPCEMYGIFNMVLIIKSVSKILWIERNHSVIEGGKSRGNGNANETLIKECVKQIESGCLEGSKRNFN